MAVPEEFQDCDAAKTLKVQEVAVEEKDVATVALVERKSDKRGVEATGWAVKMSGWLWTYSSK